MYEIEKLARVAAVYDEWNADNLESVYQFLSPRVNLTRKQIESLASFKRTLVLLKTAVPDLELVQGSSKAFDNTVMDTIVGTGTFSGEVLGCAPTGALVYFTASCSWEFEQGQIVQVEHSDLAYVLDELIRDAATVLNANDVVAE